MKPSITYTDAIKQSEQFHASGKTTVWLNAFGGDVPWDRVVTCWCDYKKRRHPSSVEFKAPCKECGLTFMWGVSLKDKTVPKEYRLDENIISYIAGKLPNHLRTTFLDVITDSMEARMRSIAQYWTDRAEDVMTMVFHIKRDVCEVKGE